jgi:hypothetical protein
MLEIRIRNVDHAVLCLLRLKPVFGSAPNPSRDDATAEALLAIRTLILLPFVLDGPLPLGYERRKAESRNAESVERGD